MKTKLIVICLFMSANLYSQAPLKKRVIMHQLQDNLNTLLTQIGADNIKEAKHKIKQLNQLLAYLQVPNVTAAFNKIKKTDAIIYEKEKENEKLAAKNERINAHANSLELTLQDIIDTKKEYARYKRKHKQQTSIDIVAKIPERLPTIKKK